MSRASRQDIWEPSPAELRDINPYEEARLYTTNAERERWEGLATLFGIIVSLKTSIFSILLVVYEVQPTKARCKIARPCLAQLHKVCLQVRSAIRQGLKSVRGTILIIE